MRLHFSHFTTFANGWYLSCACACACTVWASRCCRPPRPWTTCWRCSATSSAPVAAPPCRTEAALGLAGTISPPYTLRACDYYLITHNRCGFCCLPSASTAADAAANALLLRHCYVMVVSTASTIRPGPVNAPNLSPGKNRGSRKASASGRDGDSGSGSGSGKGQLQRVDRSVLSYSTPFRHHSLSPRSSSQPFRLLCQPPTHPPNHLPRI